MQQLTLDVRKRSGGFRKPKRLDDVRRGEVRSVELSVNVTDGSEEYDLIGKKVRFRCETGMHNAVFDDEDGGIKVTNASQGSFSHTLPDEAASDVGYAACYYDVYAEDGTYLITTECFGFNVLFNVDLSEQQAEHYVPIIDEIVKEAGDAKADLQELLAEAGGRVLPAGGASGQVLKKTESGSEWSDLPAATTSEYGAVKLVDMGNPDMTAVPTLAQVAIVQQQLQESINGKADASHTHITGDITGLSVALSAKADANHTHTPASIGAMPAVAVTASDAGKFLRVNSSGAWAAEAVPSASGVSF